MSYTQLTEGQRYQIYALLKEGLSQKAIAENIKCHPSTISRELKTNRGKRGYRPKQAHSMSMKRRQTAKKQIKLTSKVQESIGLLIEQDLSPEQAAGYIKKHLNIQLHHETIYQFIYNDKEQGGELYKHLRIANKPYRKRYRSYDRRGQIVNRVSIDERPKVVDDKVRIGDWEGDTIIGRGHKGALLTLVERKTLYTIIVPLQGKFADKLKEAVIAALEPLKEHVHTITYDNGKEFAEHEAMANASCTSSDLIRQLPIFHMVSSL